MKNNNIKITESEIKSKLPEIVNLARKYGLNNHPINIVHAYDNYPLCFNFEYICFYNDKIEVKFMFSNTSGELSITLFSYVHLYDHAIYGLKCEDQLECNISDDYSDFIVRDKICTYFIKQENMMKELEEVFIISNKLMRN